MLRRASGSQKEPCRWLIVIAAVVYRPVTSPDQALDIQAPVADLAASRQSLAA